MEEWVKKLQENMEINTQNQRSSLKNLRTQIEQLTKEFHAKAANEVPNSTVGQCKVVYANDEAAIDNTSSKETNKLHKVSFISNNDIQVAQEEDDVPSRVLPCQLPPKGLNPGSFTLPCTIESLNFYDMADLGASVNVLLKSMFEHLKLANLKKTDMLVEMDDMTKRVPIGIVENILVKVNKFLFPSDFVVIDMLKTHNETMILGRLFLATIHAEIDVFNKEIFLRIGDDKEQSSKKARMLRPDTPSTHFCKPVKQDCNGILKAPPLRSLLRSKKIANLDLGTTHSRNEELGTTKDLLSRSFDDYKGVFDLEIDQLANEYELGIGKKGHMLDDMWEYCEKVQGITRTGGTIMELEDTLPLGIENGSWFRKMIRKELEFQRKTQPRVESNLNTRSNSKEMEFEVT
ncbi:reverse transcriptase domain-containing protein [Tanacetum coccineum]